MDPINLYDYESRAKASLPHNNWEFIEAGAMDEFTTARNRSAFEDLTIRPRFLRNIDNRDLSTTMLGSEISLPVFVCPAGGHKLAHPDGELATARGAGMSNTLMMLSTSSHYSMEEVSAVATGPMWFQLYHRGHDLTEMLVHRAEEAGYKAIVLTVDTPVPSPKERDVRNQYVNPAELANFRATPGPSGRSQRHRRGPQLAACPGSAPFLGGIGLAAWPDRPAPGIEGCKDRRGRPHRRRERC